MHKLDYVPCSTLDCYFVDLAVLFSKRVIYGYKCDLEQLYQDMQDAKRFATVACYIEQCSLSGDIVDQIRKFKSTIQRTYSNICRDCVETT
jgi:hypothetical protein